MPRQHHIEIESNTRNLSQVRHFVEAHALDAGFPREVIEQVKLAVDEACANVIEHAYHGGVGRIDVYFRATAELLAVTIRDTGVPFDPAAYHKPNLEEHIMNRKPGGLGVHLMRTLMDQVRYRQHRGANEVQLVKYRNARKRSRGKKEQEA